MKHLVGIIELHTAQQQTYTATLIYYDYFGFCVFNWGTFGSKLLCSLVHSNSQFESVRFDSLDESIQIDRDFQKIGPFNSTTAWSLYAIFDCDCTVDATAAGTNAGKMSVKTSICPRPSPLFITQQ